MPNYKQRTIELTPTRYDDGTWSCPYRIIEFRATCWGYHKGTPLGVFASRDAATAAAFHEAQQVVDALGPPTQRPRSPSRSVLATYRKKVRAFLARPRQ